MELEINNRRTMGKLTNMWKLKKHISKKKNPKPKNKNPMDKEEINREIKKK